ncbi:MAG: hypothetical protein J6D37_01805 [Clostridia bacterium]|nr:hypothetical protein [Clostridia bacterium]
MKKTTKKLVAAFAAVTMACSALAFAACGGETEKTTEPQTTEIPQAKISYQFIGNYDELLSWGFVYDFRIDLTPDGVATVSIYRNEEDIATIEGTWKEAKDEDGENVMTIRDGVNPDGKYELYQESDGSYVLHDYYFTFMGGYSRKIDLKGSSKIAYEDDAAWKAAIQERRKDMDIPQPGGNQGGDKTDEPTQQPAPSEATELAVFKKDSSSITFLSDGTGKASVFGAMNRTFKWTKNGDTITFTEVKTGEGTEQGTIVLTGTTIKVTVNGGGTDYSVEFVDCDLSALK